MLQYIAELDERGRLTDESISSVIAGRKNERENLFKYQDYYTGKNPAIQEKESGRILPVPYGRFFVQTVNGFVFKPGLINYEGSGRFFEWVLDCFSNSDEKTLNSVLGRDQAIFGEAYELLWLGGDMSPRLAHVSPLSIVPVYSPRIDKKMIAAIRLYEVPVSNAPIPTSSTGADPGLHSLPYASRGYTEYADVYYADGSQTYTVNGSASIEPSGEFAIHPFGDVPLIVYKNNEESLGDIEPLAGMIDAYDALLSQATDDEEKFADALLLVYGRVLDDEDLGKLNTHRIIDGLDKDADEIKYLTKDQGASSRDALLKTLRDELHRHSFIPDLTNPSTLGQKSGEAFQYLFGLFELMASVKETYFLKGLKRRLNLLSSAYSFPYPSTENTSLISISFTRNLPKDNVMWANIFSTLNGLIPDDVLVPTLPFVSDPARVIRDMKAMKTKEPPAPPDDGSAPE